MLKCNAIHVNQRMYLNLCNVKNLMLWSMTIMQWVYCNNVLQCMLCNASNSINVIQLMLEEEKQRRLERTRILKLILGKKLGARKLRRMISMMELMTIDDLEMESEEVEAKATEMMETEDEYTESRAEEMKLIEEAHTIPMRDLVKFMMTPHIKAKRTPAIRKQWIWIWRWWLMTNDLPTIRKRRRGYTRPPQPHVSPISISSLWY